MVKTLTSAALLAMAVAGSSSAAIIVFETPNGATQSSLPVSARATFITGNNSLRITLENLLVNPTGVSQNLSGLSFTLDSGLTAATLSSSSGLERSVNQDRTFTDGGMVSTGWAVGLEGAAIKLNVLGSGTGPAHTILGSPNDLGLYSNANGSIRNNGPHNPFLANSATFDLAISGLTEASIVNAGTFFFNTTNGNSTTAQRISTTVVPEPAALSALALAGAALLRRKLPT